MDSQKSLGLPLPFFSLTSLESYEPTWYDGNTHSVGEMAQPDIITDKLGETFSLSFPTWKEN